MSIAILLPFKGIEKIRFSCYVESSTDRPDVVKKTLINNTLQYNCCRDLRKTDFNALKKKFLCRRSFLALFKGFFFCWGQKKRPYFAGGRISVAAIKGD